MKHKAFLNYHEEHIPAKYDEEGEMIEPPHIYHYYRYRNYNHIRRVSVGYKFIDEVVGGDEE